MYTPPQWRIAFPVVGLVVAASAVVLAHGWQVGDACLVGGAAGIIAGLAFSIAWTMRRFLPLLAIALFAIGSALLGLLLEQSAMATMVGVAMATFVFAAWFIGYEAIWTGRFHRATTSPIELLGGESDKRALIVFHSAHRGFQRTIQRALAEGLVARGWHVAMMTASAQAPGTIDEYDLLVLGAPTYNWSPARAITSYVARLRELHGMNVVLVVSGGGMTERAMKSLRRQVEAAHGHVVEALELWTRRENLAQFGTTDPREIMFNLGADLARRLD